MFGKFKSFKSVNEMVSFLNEHRHACGQGTVKEFKCINDNIMVYPKDARYEPAVKDLLGKGNFTVNQTEKAYEVTPLKAHNLFNLFLEFEGTIYQMNGGYCYIQKPEECSDQDREVVLKELIETALESDELRQFALLEMAKLYDMKSLVEEYA